MADSNQEGYQTLGWIVNKSEQGLFLVIVDESMQQEIEIGRASCRERV